MRLGRNFVIYLTSSVVAGAMPLALMPLLTRSLAPVQFGTMVTITTLMMLVLPLLTWSTTSYVAVQYFKVEPQRFPRLLSSVLLIPLAVLILLTTLSAASAPLLSRWFGVSAGWNVAIAAMAAAQLMPQFAQTILAMRDRAIGYAAFEIGAAALGFVGTLILVLGLNLGWQGRLYALVGGYVALSAVAAAWLRTKGLLIGAANRADIADAFRFGAGGVAHDMANQASRVSDRLLIVALIGEAALGGYAVAVQWSSIMLTVIAAFNRAWTPFLFSSLASDDQAAPGRIVRHTYLVWFGFAGFWAVFNLVTPLGYAILVDDRYHASIGVVRWLTTGMLFYAIYITFVDYIFYLKKTHFLAVITTSNLVLNVTLSYPLIRHQGAVGAAMGFAATAFIVMLATAVTSQRLHPMPWLRSFGR